MPGEQWSHERILNRVPCYEASRMLAGLLVCTAMQCACRAMDAKLAGMQASMDLTRTWIVVDMDAFFASVEELDDPSLVGPFVGVE